MGDMGLSGRIKAVIMLIVGIIAIGLLTWGVGKIYIELLGKSSHANITPVQTVSTDTNTLTGNVLTLAAAKFWTCQVGVFQSDKNAQIKKEQLMVLNLKAEVISTNPWTVGIGLGHSAEELKGLKQALTDKGIATVAKQFELPERSFRVTGNGTQLTAELLTNVNTILQVGLTPEALVKENQVWNALAGDHPPTQLEGLHLVFNKIREKTTVIDQKVLALSLYFESQRVINKLSGK